VDDAYARSYRQLYEQHWWWRARERLIVEEVRRLGQGRPWRRILDVGCGDGLSFPALTPFGDVEGVEPVAHLVDQHASHRDRIYIGPFDAGFVPDKKYGLITMLDVLEHLEDPQAALEHARTLLESDGRIVVTVPAFNVLWTAHDDLNHHVTRYTRRRFVALAEQAGLRIHDARYFFHWLFFAKLLVRASEALSRRPPTPATVPPAVVNRALTGLCLLEQGLLWPMRVPFGSSLFVVMGQ